MTARIARRDGMSDRTRTPMHRTAWHVSLHPRWRGRMPYAILETTQKRVTDRMATGSRAESGRDYARPPRRGLGRSPRPREISGLQLVGPLAEQHSGKQPRRCRILWIERTGKAQPPPQRSPCVQASRSPYGHADISNVRVSSALRRLRSACDSISAASARPRVTCASASVIAEVATDCSPARRK